MIAAPLLMLVIALFAATASAGEERLPDSTRDILVTLASAGPASVSGGNGAPYHKRKRYSTSLDTQLLAAKVADDYALEEIAHWPIRSLSVLCIVFRVADPDARDLVIGLLRADPRIDSAQPLQRFTTQASPVRPYDDTYIGLQRGLEVMGVRTAHRYSRGRGIDIAVVDGPADVQHEDLQGRITAIHDFTDPRDGKDAEHGTAVASIIGASANNARGIVGVAPESDIEVYVACWKERDTEAAACSSFTLAKALDALVSDPADVVNLSLSGPYDPLLERLLAKLARAGAAIVAARPVQGRAHARFPASLAGIIGAASGDRISIAMPASTRVAVGSQALHAPAERIVVALPRDHYDFRSGSSLAAAHVSGVAALLLSVSPNLSANELLQYLRASEQQGPSGISINACVALRLADSSRTCP
jgi:Subtilase family